MTGYQERTASLADAVWKEIQIFTAKQV